MNFSIFSKAVQVQYDKLVKGELYFTKMDRDELFATYLASFPEGTNPIYKTRTEYDCTCCKQFIRNTGHVVGFVNGEMQSIWDIEIEDGPFKVVAQAMAAYVKAKPIDGIFRSESAKIGSATTHQHTENGVLTWNHFAYELPNKFVVKNESIAEFNGRVLTNKQMLERALKEISLEACEIVKDLIDQNSLYRGAEHLKTVQLALKMGKLNKSKPLTETDLWQTSADLGESSRYKNSVIGTLLTDISSGVELEDAVKMFESKVAPQNYKRPTALITPGMIKKAQETVTELGLELALHRRHAVTDDLTVNNVLFADRAAKKAMSSVFDELSTKVKDKAPSLDKVQEMGIEEFLEKVLPNATNLELMLDNKHTANLMSVVAPHYCNAGSLLKWNNNFSWSYNGEVADSMKERVKAAGGNVEGVLRFSIQWNDNLDDNSDLDAHCNLPDGTSIYFANPRNQSSGTLDVDIRYPEKKVAVENIVFTSTTRMPEGVYNFIVHNFSNRGSKGFSAQVEFDGAIYPFVYDRPLRDGERVQVAQVKYIKKNGFGMLTSLKAQTQTKDIWNIQTNKWVPVKLLMNSPNHWDENASGNKHWFFILEGCKNPDSVRGFYNEFLKDELQQHRKVFETLGAQLKAPYAEEQLSGVGFSSTITNSVLCKVSGNFNRVIKIIF